MEVKTKEDWLYQFRRCSSRETLEKVISHTRYKLTPAEMEAFNVTNGAIVIHTQRLKSDPGGNLLS